MKIVYNTIGKKPTPLPSSPFFKQDPTIEHVEGKPTPESNLSIVPNTVKKPE